MTSKEESICCKKSKYKQEDGRILGLIMLPHQFINVGSCVTTHWIVQDILKQARVCSGSCDACRMLLRDKITKEKIRLRTNGRQLKTFIGDKSKV